MVEIQETRILIDKIVVNEEKPFVVVGIPAFNEEHSIARIVIEAQKFADAVIVCDDGSSDLTAKIAERLGADIIRHEQNSGYGSAIKSLFERALEFGADVLVTIDGDGQHNPSEIPNIVKPVAEGTADIVIGSRFVDSHGTDEMPFYRRVGANVITKLVNGSSNTGVKDSQSGFRAYNRQALQQLSVLEAGMGASVEILLSASKQDLKIQEVPSTCKYNIDEIDTSTKHPITHGVSVIASIIRLIVEEKPLIILGIPGILCLLSGVLFGVWMLQIYAIENHIVTNIALASLAFTLIGFFTLSTSITLYAIARIAPRIRKNSNC
jgi:glycosyltransferase involved in cell wall biosynthesis